jgi:hypothetical protein
MVFLGAVGKLTRFADFTRAAQWIVEKKPTGGATAPSEAQATPIEAAPQPVLQTP